MIRKVRTKVASTISKINEVDDFNFTSWLRKPPIEQHTIEEIDSDLENTSELVISIDESENFGHDFLFDEPDVQDEFPHYTFPKVRSNAIFFMIAVPLEKFVFYPESEIKKINFSERKFKFLLTRPTAKKIQVGFDDVVYKNIECVIQVPESYNYLKEEIPEVINIDLLGISDIMGENGQAKILDFKLDTFKKTKIAKQSLPELPKLKKIFKVKIPSIAKFNSTHKEIPVPDFFQTDVTDAFPAKIEKVKSYFAKFQISNAKSFLLYTTSKEKLAPETEEKSSVRDGYQSLKEELKYILSNVKKVDWEKSKNVNIKLKEYEESATKFLVESDFALLQDELGIDSEKEVIAALKILLKNRIVKSALIITSQNKKGFPKLGKQFNTHSGWTDKIVNHGSDLSFTLIEGNDKERAELWNKPNSICVASLDTTINDFYFKTLTQSRLEKFDCLVFDNAHLLPSTGEKGKKFSTLINSKIIWAVSGVLDKNLQKELNEWLGPAIEISKTQARNKEEIKEQVPRITWNEMWVEADENQVKEFKVTMSDCKKELKRVLESENPLRFTANIFTLLHRLNQLGNFAPNKPDSPKTDLLLEHLSTIKSNGKKALILSQYDRQGTKKLSEFLTSEGIRQVTVHGGTPVEEINKSISLFNSERDIVAFIADSKATKIKYSDLNVSYVIKFDQWWNPINNWEFEDVFLNEENSSRESINFFNYSLLGGIDIKVRELLLRNELLNKNIFELMQPKIFEELISVEDWLRVFDMPLNEEEKVEIKPEVILKQLNLSSINTFRKLLLQFFAMLGYSNLDVLELQDSHAFNIIGRGKRNKRNFSLVARVFTKKELDKKTLESVLSESSTSINDKIFIISKGELPELSDIKINDNVVLLDGLTLARYLIKFGLAKAEE